MVGDGRRGTIPETKVGRDIVKGRAAEPAALPFIHIPNGNIDGNGSGCYLFFSEQYQIEPHYMKIPTSPGCMEWL